MRRLTQSEAIELLETVFEVAPDNYGSGVVDAVIADCIADLAMTDVESFLAIIAGEIDPESISITPDQIEGSSMDCTAISIKTEG